MDDMDYKGKMLMDEFSEYSKEELLVMKKGCEKLLLYTNELLVFAISMALFCSPSIVLMLTFGSSLTELYYYNFVAAFAAFFFIVRKKFVDVSLREGAKSRLEEIEFVLENRN